MKTLNIIRGHSPQTPERHCPDGNRLFFYPKDVLIAVQMGFRPTPGCGERLHKVWRAVQGKHSEISP